MVEGSPRLRPTALRRFRRTPTPKLFSRSFCDKAVHRIGYFTCFGGLIGLMLTIARDRLIDDELAVVICDILLLTNLTVLLCSLLALIVFVFYSIRKHM